MVQCNDIAFSLFLASDEFNDDKNFVKELFNVFFEDGFIVTTVQFNDIQINVPGNPLKIVERPQLINNKKNEIINIMPDRIDFIKGTFQTEILDGNLQVSSVDFENSKHGINYIIQVMEMMSKKASRLAYNTNYTSNKTYIEKPNSFNDFLKDKQVSNSTNRVEIHDSFEDELTNVIHEVKYSSQPYLVKSGTVNQGVSGELIHNDINTDQNKKQERFSGDQVKRFFKYANEVNRKLIAGV